MKLLLIAVIFVGMLSISYGCLGRGIYRNSQNPDQCSYNTETVMDEGDVLPLPSGECGQIECRANNEVLTKGCPVIKADKGCRLLDADTTAPYPRCCERKQVCGKRKPKVSRIVDSDYE